MFLLLPGHDRKTILLALRAQKGLFKRTVLWFLNIYRIYFWFAKMLRIYNFLVVPYEIGARTDQHYSKASQDIRFEVIPIVGMERGNRPEFYVFC